MLREVLAIPSKGSGQQPWKLRPPHVLLVGRRWLQAKGGSHLKPSAPQASLLPRALARVLEEHATCRRCIQWEKLPEHLGGGRGVRVPRGASVWPAVVDATFLKKKQQCWERQR